MSLDKKVLSTQEATSLGAFGGNWRAGSAMNIASGAQADFALDLDTTIILINTPSEIYINIDNVADTAIDTANDMVLPAGVYTIQFPKGVQDGDVTEQLHIHAMQVVSVAAKTIRIVEA